MAAEPSSPTTNPWRVLWVSCAGFLCMGVAVGTPTQALAISELSSVETRGLYISAGAGYIQWSDHSLSDVETEEGEDGSLSISFERGTRLSVAFGNAAVARLFRTRYEIEVLRSTSTIKIVKTETDSGLRLDEVKGEVTITGANLSAFYDLPPFVKGRLTPYVGINALILNAEIEAPAPVTPEDDQSSLEEIAEDAVLKDTTITYGYGYTVGVRIELSQYLAIDAGYRRTVYDTVQDDGTALLVGDKAEEVRASLVLRF